MTDTITVTGAVGSDPRVHVTSQGLAITSFRLASTRRYFDRAKGAWEDGETNWYTVSGFRQLANNAAISIRKGDRVVVHGRHRLRAWDNGEKSGTAIEIEAEAIGHDLTWGTTVLTKVRREPAPDTEAGGSSESNAWPGSEGVVLPAGLGSVAADEGLDDLAEDDDIDAGEAQLASAV
ncbi:single-strand DNA-binding protein [Agromyces sp. 3263]|uniref:single-stranded DNA-binding protein n=1 Tax=Agromyces sp. 3263 TaxID=2817750 RepID=UPI00285865CF|nr:single-stranded DNA-binding protein [Agromyces sp. 3263]MDR6907546.1 single-strand DNA-binding protein [Agromyces sp. 3263]